MSNWYQHWVVLQQDRKALDCRLETQRLAREVQDTKLQSVEPLPRLLFTVGCWLVERAWQLRHEQSALRWGRVEVYQISHIQNGES